MNAIVPVTQDPKMLALIRRTVAKDCDNDEFDLFISMARSLGLDPLRRQIYCFVYNKGNAAKRKMTIVTAIDGFRTIAERTGNYRPDEDEASFETDPELKGPTNPAGLVKATVRVFKFSHGAWHKVTASAYWEEYAPLKETWSKFENTGETWPDGNPKTRPAPDATKIITLDTSGQWGKMPRVMLAKVAEALALRKAWPDDFSSVYAAEEVEKQNLVDLTPSEWVDEAAKQDRIEKIGGPAVLIDWMDNKGIDRVVLGKFADRAIQFLDQSREEPAAVKAWAELNRHALRDFWSHNATDALVIKKKVEQITAGLPAPAPAEAAE